MNHRQRFILAKSRKGHYMKPIGQIYLDLIQENREQFSDEFVEWLPNNGHIWHYFAIETFKIIENALKETSADNISVATSVDRMYDVFRGKLNTNIAYYSFYLKFSALGVILKPFKK